MKIIVAVFLIAAFSQVNAVGSGAACDQPTTPDSCDAAFTCLKTSGCTQGVCGCAPGTTLVGVLCLAIAKISETCSDVLQCVIPTTVCATTCNCPVGGTPTSDNLKCLLATDKIIGGACAGGDTCYSYTGGMFLNMASATECASSVCVCKGQYKTVGDHCELRALDEVCLINSDCTHLGDAECVGTTLACKCVRGVEATAGMCPMSYVGGYNLAGDTCLTPSTNQFATCVAGTACLKCPEEPVATNTFCRGTITPDAVTLLNLCPGKTTVPGATTPGGSGAVGLAASLITIGLSALFTMM